MPLYADGSTVLSSNKKSGYTVYILYTGRILQDRQIPTPVDLSVFMKTEVHKLCGQILLYMCIVKKNVCYDKHYTKTFVEPI